MTHTIHAEKRCEEMCDFGMAALMFVTGHGIKARAASCFPGPDDAPCWDMCDLGMGLGS